MMTVGQVADRLSLSQGAVYAAIRRQELPCVRVGRSVRVPAFVIEEMEQGTWSGSSTTGGDGTPPRPSTGESTERPFEPLIALLPSGD